MARKLLLILCRVDVMVAAPHSVIQGQAMYKFCRFLLIVALLEFAIAAAVITIVWWPWPMLLAVVVAGAAKMRQGRDLWSHGTSKWATEFDLRSKGMVDSDTGVIVGRLEAPGRVPLWGSVLPVLDARTRDKAACFAFLARAGLALRGKKGSLVRVNQTPHTLVCAPTGKGKGASLVIPQLLDMNSSAVVLDIKGELAVATARHRERKFGHRIVLMDPFHVVTKTPDCLNPIDFISRESNDSMDNCRALAGQLVVRTEDEREPHWNDGAEMYIGGAIAAVVQQAATGERSLQTVRDVLSNPDNIPKLLELLCQSGGMTSRLGGQLAFFRDKELSSVMTTANRHLRFLDTPAVAAVTRHSTFNPAELRNGKMTVYVIVPPTYVRTQTPLLRISIGTLMQAVVRGGLQHV